MSLRFRIDILPALKSKGFNTNKLRQEKLLSESTIQKLRTGTGVSWGNIETLCRLLECQPGDILEFLPDSEEENT